MIHATAAGFRAVLEDRLNRTAAHCGVPPTRLRMLVVFERSLARLQVVASGRWVVKGGVALELRLPGRARTTKGSGPRSSR